VGKLDGGEWEGEEKKKSKREKANDVSRVRNAV